MMVNSIGASTHMNHVPSMVSRKPPVPINQDKVELDASYTPANLEIKTRNPEMKADWDQVWEERGFLKISGQIKEIKAIAIRNAQTAITEEVQGGLRARNIHTEKGNVFGRIAFDEFLASRTKQIQLDAAPKFGVKIDVRIFPPEIKVDTNVKGVKGG